MIVARLGRESTLLTNEGNYVKDLSYLNRDLKDVVYIDFSDEKAQFHKDNVIILPRWEGDSKDRELYDIMPFLENLAQAHGSDARAEIKKFGREGTGKKYIELQTKRREFILSQREKGLGGMMGRLSQPTPPPRGTNQQ
jgi:mitochondrial import inner membrane translocase subunit TIM50